MKRLFKIGLVAAGLLVAAHTPAGGRVAHSVLSVGRQLHTGAGVQSISMIERLVLSLATLS